MKSFLNIGVAFVSIAVLAGCNILYTPSYTTQNRVQVSEEEVVSNIPLSDANDAFIEGLARHYTKHGGGDMDLIVTYDPRSRGNTAMRATNKVADIVAALRTYGVVDVKARILPVKAQGNDSRLIVSYNSFKAHAPKGCENTMPGMNGRVEVDRDYKLGCSIETMLARQVAKPSHLLGRGAAGDNTDGRSATNIVDAYRSGAQNEPLEGESATDD